MTQKRIAIIGVGGIGQRHLQSCCTLPEKDYQIHVVDPSAERRANAAALVSVDDGNPEIVWHEAIADLPETLDLAVVATRADVRADATQLLVETKKVKRLILEKVLFQKLDAYERVGALLAKAGVQTWVNCPARLYPGYREISAWLDGRPVTALKMSGAEWDIGCNAIHNLDLFAYLAGSTECNLDAVSLVDVKPAKRAGMLQLEGQMDGTLRCGDGRSVPYQIVSGPGIQEDRVIEVSCQDGTVKCTEAPDRTMAIYPDGKEITRPIPFQSQLTAPIVEQIFETGSCDLPDYASSRRLHEAMIAGFLEALNAKSLLTETDRCPIT